MSAILAQALNQGVSTTTATGLVGGGASFAALLGLAWMYHHAHRTHQETKTTGPNGKAKHDPRRTVVGALVLGILLATGGGVIGNSVSSGATSITSVLS
jgi:amino acid transporter